ncbi:MAG: hypothetical protein JEY71_07080 [Sphaerochaeta sp.]|nr:hypothetical protein [Sphaerochaeta sp.]
MQFISLILFLAACLGVCCGFYYGSTNFSGHSYEFSLLIAWPWFSSALLLLAAAAICFALSTLIDSLVNISSNLRNVAISLDKLSPKSLPEGNFSKAGDDPRFPRFRGETNQEYWGRIATAGSNT